MDQFFCRIEDVQKQKIPGLEEKVTVLHRGDLHTELRNMATWRPDVRVAAPFVFETPKRRVGKAWEKHGKTMGHEDSYGNFTGFFPLEMRVRRNHSF